MGANSSKKTLQEQTTQSRDTFICLEQRKLPEETSQTSKESQKGAHETASAPHQLGALMPTAQLVLPHPPSLPHMHPGGQREEPTRCAGRHHWGRTQPGYNLKRDPTAGLPPERP